MMMKNGFSSQLDHHASRGAHPVDFAQQHIVASKQVFQCVLTTLASECTRIYLGLRAKYGTDATTTAPTIHQRVNFFYPKSRENGKNGRVVKMTIGSARFAQCILNLCLEIRINFASHAIINRLQQVGSRQQADAAPRIVASN